MGVYIDKINVLYIKELFPNLDIFVRKYCKFLQNGTEENNFMISASVDPKEMESTLMEVAANQIGRKLTKFLNNSEQSLTGYSLKVLVRRFSSVFSKYYGQIYKYAKGNHAAMASTMLQTHSMIK